MKIVIGHLFYDLLNLYGESGNILAIKNELESKNVEVEVKNISIEDELIIDELDLIYIGEGTENNQIICLDYLKKYKEDIKKAIDNNKIFIATGNAIELFGKEILDINNEKIDALGVFDYCTKRTKNRIVAECEYYFDEIEYKIVGFYNYQGIIEGIKDPLFIKKDENGNVIKTDGIHINNFFGTYLIGPLFVRNPEFLDYIINKMTNSKQAIKTN